MKKLKAIPLILCMVFISLNYITSITSWSDPNDQNHYFGPIVLSKSENILSISDDAYSESLISNWVNIFNARGIKAYPELKEYVWQMERAPYGPFDKIGLHRVVKEGIDPKGVIFFCPGTWMNGEQLISNPPEDWWTMYENYSLPYYLANKDFDVYAIDYRTHFVPDYLTTEQLSFMSDWGWEQWMSDIKEAVDLAKETSGVEKIYMAGQSFGGRATMNHASLFWEDDLKGIILLDGGTGTKYPDLVTNSVNLTSSIEFMKETGEWARFMGTRPESIFVLQYGDQNPGAPAEFPIGVPLQPEINPYTNLPWNNIAEYLTFAIYFAWGPGGVSNLYGGYGDPFVMIHQNAQFDNWWPSRLGLESAAISDWDDCPYIPYDFDDHYSEVDIPLIAFTSGIFGNGSGDFRFINGIANPDFTGIMLPEYGHLDVYFGEYSEDDVSVITYDWLLNRRMLEGFGKIKNDDACVAGISAIYINEYNIDFKVENIRLNFNIMIHKIYEIFEIYIGKNEQGWINIIIAKNGISMVFGQNIRFYGYLV